MVVRSRTANSLARTSRSIRINSDFFVLTAELAVAIAGFSGVIVALESQPVGSWAPSRRRDLRVLLQLSGLALVFSLVPLVAYAVADTAGFWRWALAAYGLIHAADVFTFLYRQPDGVRRPVWLGLVFALAQILVAALLTDAAAEAMYMISVMWHLGGAAMPRGQEDPLSGGPPEEGHHLGRNTKGQGRRTLHNKRLLQTRWTGTAQEAPALR